MAEIMIMLLRLLSVLLIAGLGVAVTLFTWTAVGIATKWILGMKP